MPALSTPAYANLARGLFMVVFPPVRVDWGHLDDSRILGGTWRRVSLKRVSIPVSQSRKRRIQARSLDLVCVTETTAHHSFETPAIWARMVARTQLPSGAGSLRPAPVREAEHAVRGCRENRGS